MKPAVNPVPTLYNHDILLYTQEVEGGVHLYSGRVLGLTQPDDLIQLHPDLQRDFAAILAHYQQVGLSVTQQVIWQVDMTEINHHPGYDLSVYFFGSTRADHPESQAFFAQRDLRWSQTAAYINSKNNFMALAHQLAIPVPLTLCYATPADLPSLETLPYPCYFKPSISDHGFGISRCSDPVALQTALGCLHPGESFQVQQEVSAIAFLNLQYQVVGDRLERVLASEQVLQGCVHQGNRYPTAYEPWEMVDPMSHWLHDQGMGGVFAFDVAVCPNGEGAVSYLAIECNPRFNGSSYPTAIAHRLGIPQWSTATCAVKARGIAELDLTGLTFDPATGEGIILVNWGTIQAGKVGLLLGGSGERSAQLLASFQARNS